MRQFLVALLLLLTFAPAPVGARRAVNLVANGQGVGVGGNTAVVAAINTTGAKLIIAYVTGYTVEGTLTDNQTNTWVPGGVLLSVGNLRFREWYVVNPNVSATHTFTNTVATSSDDPSLCVMAFDSVLFVEGHQQLTIGGATTQSLPIGNIVPVYDNEVITTGWSRESTVTNITLGSPMNITNSWAGNGSAAPNACGYEIQTTATTRNPTWGWIQGPAAGIASGWVTNLSIPNNFPALLVAP